MISRNQILSQVVEYPAIHCWISDRQKLSHNPSGQADMALCEANPVLWILVLKY